MVVTPEAVPRAVLQLKHPGHEGRRGIRAFSQHETPVILKQDKPLKNAWWLYDEIYKSDNGFEIHVLLQNKELIDFTVNVTDVEYIN